MKSISTNPQTLHIKRTSLWNKANEELKKHQLLVERVKEKREDFYNEPYGDPFASEEMRCVCAVTNTAIDFLKATIKWVLCRILKFRQNL